MIPKYYLYATEPLEFAQGLQIYFVFTTTHCKHLVSIYKALVFAQSYAFFIFNPKCFNMGIDPHV